MAHRVVPEDEFWHWLTPAQALGRLSQLTVPARKRWIARRLKSRQITAAAKTVIYLSGPTVNFHILDSSAWRKWAAEIDDDFWEAGDYCGLMVSSTGYGAQASANFEAYDVRLDPAPFEDRDEERHAKNAESWARVAEAVTPGFERMLRTINSSPSPSPDELSGTIPAKPHQRRRGPKPKVFWRPAIAAVEASISAKEFQPESLADVERAMASWLDDNGHEAGELTIRLYAKKVWDPIDPQGQ